MGYLCKDQMIVLVVMLTLMDCVGGMASWKNRAKLGMLMAAMFVPADLYVLYTVALADDNEFSCDYKPEKATQPTMQEQAVSAIRPTIPAAHVPTVAVQAKLVAA